MAMFSSGKKGEQQRGGSVPQRSGNGTRGVMDSMSIIGPGMHIVGDIVTDGTVRIEGRIDGTIRAGKAVVVGKEGEVQGEIFTQDAVIGGTVRGSVTAESRLELQATCNIQGQIQARSQHLQLEEGARFNGQIQMLDGGEQPRALPASLPESAPAHAAPSEAIGENSGFGS
ncbi:MAG TPA: polymer-forming cytoskeletal protein [Longimicrobium sp.]|nr:polymer-forming cytoskeletal protein [Longimicrobium sp.]